MNDSDNNSSQDEPVETQQTTMVATVEPETAEQASLPQEKPTPGSSNTNEKFVAFTQELETINETEAKLKHTITFMEDALSQENGVPQFKNFWDARDICIALFKEPLSHQVREVLWARYSELSKEARRLKDILDEQSAFAVEQIQIAIGALEEEIASIDRQLKELTSDDASSESLPEQISYQHVQNELNLLNAYAARVNSMRKELIKTDMRVRHKNRFFQRLSAAGDKVFPRRKELIATISERFVSDVDHFIDRNFSEEQLTRPAFELREEIKALQSLAKGLTLNTHAFTSTRMKLSQVWDRLKEVAKERKKIRAEIQAEVRENLEQHKQRIDAVANEFAAGNLSADEAARQLDSLSHEMRRLKLGRDEVKYLKDAMKTARDPIQAKLDEAVAQREEELRQQEQKRRQVFEALKEQVYTFMDNTASIDADALTQTGAELRQQIQQGSFSKMEKREIEVLLKPLADIIQEKREQALMNLSDDDQKALLQLREVLDQRIERRLKIKEQLETLRKDSGSSGLDFEQAMAFNEQITVERERLEKINHGISEIEEKIEELESKVY